MAGEYTLGTAVGRIIIDGSKAKEGFSIAEAAADAFYQTVQEKIESVDKLGTRLIAIGTAGSVGLGGAVKAAATFEQGLSAIAAVSGATEKEMENLRAAALRIGKDTSFSATEAAKAIEELVKAGISTEDVLNGAADGAVALAAAGEIDLPRAAEIASSAINNFALSGKDMPHVADLIAGAANASAISVEDFGYSMSQAGSVANLTGLKFDDLAVAIAEMGNAGIKGSDAGTSLKTFLTQLIPTTNQQIGMFQELGLSTFSASKAMEVLAKNGVKPAGKDSASLTKQLQELAAELSGSEVGSAKANKAFIELGQNGGFMQNQFFNASGEMKSMREVQEVLQNSTQNLTKEQKLNTLNILFGSDAIRASAVLANNGAEGFDKMAGSMSKVTAEAVAAKRLDNLNGSIEQLKGSFETAQIIIGEVFLPVLQKLVQALSFVIDIFNNLPAPVQKTIAVMLAVGSASALLTGVFIKLALALGPMLARMLGLMAFKQVLTIFTTGFKVFRGGAGATAAMAAAFTRGGVVMTRFAKIGKLVFNILVKFPKVLALLRGAAAIAFGPWGIVIAVVIAALVLLYKKFEPFRDLVNGIASAIRNAFGGAIAYVKDQITLFVNALRTGMTEDEGTPIESLALKIRSLGKVFTWVKEQFSLFVNALRTGMTEDEGTPIETLALKLRDLWGVIKMVAGVFMDLGRVFMENVWPALQEAGGQIMDTLIQAWGILSTMFREQVLPALQQLGAAFMGILPQLMALWETIQPVLKVLGIIAVVIVGVVVVAIYLLIRVILLLLPPLLEVATFIVQVVIAAITLFIAILVAAVTAVVGFATGIVNAVSGALGGFKQVIGGLIAIVRNFIGLITNLITGDWKGAWDNAKKIVGGVKDIIVGLIKGLGSVVINLIKGLVTGVVNFFKSLYNTLVGHSIVPDMVNAIVRWFASLPGKAMDAVRSLVSKFVSFFTDMFRQAVSAIKTGVGNAMDAVRSIKDKITGFFSGAGNWLVNAGKQIISGLINGIENKVGALRSKLNGVTKLIPDWKGPEDRDKVLLTKNGQLIMEGLMNGIQDKIGPLRALMQDITNQIPTYVNAVDATAPVSVRRQQTKNGITEYANMLKDRASAAKSEAIKDRISQITNQFNVFNPIAEKTSVTTTKIATRRAQLGVLA